MTINAKRKITSSKAASLELSPGAKRAHANAFMANGISYCALGLCAAEGYTLPGVGALLLSPLVSTWLLASRWRVNFRHEFVGGLTSAAVALVPTLAKSLAPAAKHSALGTLLAQSLLMFALLAACSLLAHGCGTALAQQWPMRFNRVSRKRRRAERPGAGPAKSWQALAAFCDAVEPLVPVLAKLVPSIERILMLAIVCLACVLIRWLSH